MNAGNACQGGTKEILRVPLNCFLGGRGRGLDEGMTVEYNYAHYALRYLPLIDDPPARLSYFTSSDSFPEAPGTGAVQLIHHDRHLSTFETYIKLRTNGRKRRRGTQSKVGLSIGLAVAGREPSARRRA